MSLIAALEALVEAGATPEMMLAVARKMEAAREDALTKRRASDAARQAAQRQRNSVMSRDGHVTERDSAGPSPHVGERPQVVTPSLPSLRSEEVKNPPEKPTVSTPKGAETARGTRLPDDWVPPAGLIAGDFGLSHEAYADQVAIFRDYWRAVPGAKGRKADWPATWRNWVRRASANSARKAPHERPHPDQRATAYAERLGDIGAAMEAALQHGRGSG